MTNGHLPIECLRIARETDKAILIQCVNARGAYRDVWFPKSQVEVANGILWAPEWLVDAKARDIGGLITISRDVAQQIMQKAA